jgi:hypothetical protein
MGMQLMIEWALHFAFKQNSEALPVQSQQLFSMLS